ncbi:MAG: nitroreductase family protein [Desulfurococcales archaeon]|nr:nitroreductase family protein [Desulfurococcales archaeon]
MCDLEKCIELLLTRRSIRRFKDEEVSLDIVKKILDITRYAPSAKNRQPWEFIIVSDHSIKDKLSRIHLGARPLARAPLGLVVVCDNEIAPESYQVDCANAAMYIMLAAHALGLGTVWIQTLRNTREIQEILGLPPNKIPIAILAIGWPAENPAPKPRKTLKDLVHINKYGNKLL